jgi:ABC-type phosphate transport system permease subunit
MKDPRAGAYAVVGLTLLLFTFSLNMVSEYLMAQVMKTSRGTK